ncbi:FkbM family methyltransferase [Paenibacillus sp. 32352]|uniref:FkbM family methyltransferase n=1 Tax=Paenibacillus sp. 32352 TaxID=1969111 RepID=UPI0009AE6062|nr:FkbM family methyltransferase [Paenibacillus sp. 32352]
MSYYNKLRLLFSNISSLLDNRVMAPLVDSYEYNRMPVAIYGGGHFGQLWFKYLVEDLHLTPDFFVDQDIEKQGKKLMGIPVVSLDELAQQTNGRAEVVVTPHSLNSKSEMRQEFEEICKQWGFNLHFIPVQYSNALEMRYAINQANCLNAIDMLYDDFSKASYYEYIRSKLAGEAYKSPYFDYSQQYLANDLFVITDSDYIVDCGAYDGDTLKSFSKSYPNVRGIASFEPTPDTFQKLKATAASLHKDNIRIFNMATGDQNTNVSFTLTNVTSGNRVSNDGSLEIRMCTLDEMLFNERPTYIKMDVEGSELSSLYGAKQIISEFTPILAICIYHKPEDLFEIPFFIKKEFPAYRLYVRKYTNDPYELVLYAVPPYRCTDNIGN